MGDLEAMTVDYANIELAAKRGNPSVIWRSGQDGLWGRARRLTRRALGAFKIGSHDYPSHCL